MKLRSCEVIGNSVLFVHSALWEGLIQLMISNVRKGIKAHLTERKSLIIINTAEVCVSVCVSRAIYGWVGVCITTMTLHFHSCAHLRVQVRVPCVCSLGCVWQNVVGVWGVLSAMAPFSLPCSKPDQLQLILPVCS